MGAEIAGHEHQGIAEMVGAFAGSDPQQAVVEYVEQRMDHFRAGLFQFVEENDAGAPGTAVQLVLLQQGGALLRPDVARRRTGEGGGIVLLGQGVHVHPAEPLGVAVQGPGQGAHDLGLADPGGAEEQRAEQRTARVGDVRANHLEHVLDGL